MENAYKFLFVVATPIGNLGDITFRAVETLKSVDFVICEDTRVTGKLLNHFKIKKPMVSLNEFNEQNLVFEILERLKKETGALVCDAGTPLISDPGFLLVRKAVQNRIKLIPIPGPSALVTALSISGMPTDKFTFLGFLPKSSAKSEKILKNFKSLNHTIILYESPHRLSKTLEVILKIYGNIEISVSRELTKIHEETMKGKVEEILQIYQKKEAKGEFVLILSPKSLHI